jgi:hypothetical protein
VEKAFLASYKTRIGAFYEGRSGKPYSWVYANDMNGDGILSNDLMFIPRAFGSGDVIFLGDTAANGRPAETKFWQVVNDNVGLQKYTGSVTERNSAFSPRANSVDVRLSQELPDSGTRTSRSSRSTSSTSPTCSTRSGATSTRWGSWARAGRRGRS